MASDAGQGALQESPFSGIGPRSPGVGYVVKPIARSRMMDRRDLHDKPNHSVVGLSLSRK
jgi:hypothetical protein